MAYVDSYDLSLKSHFKMGGAVPCWWVVWDA